MAAETGARIEDGAPGTVGAGRPGVRLDAPAATSALARLPVVDAGRGLALLAMAVYHFCWDLSYFGLINADVAQGFGWRWAAHLIAGSFLALVGISLVLATRRGLKWRPYLRRLGLIVAAGLLVVAATRILFPEAYIFFGILQVIAVSSVLGLAFLRLPWWATLIAAAAVFAAPHFLASPFFDRPLLWWTGLLTVYPVTNDFEPVLPWFGAVLVGIAAARLVLPRGEAWLARLKMKTAVPRALAWSGRHSLIIYLLHQPVLFSIAWLLAAALVTPAPPGAAFRQGCIEACRSRGQGAPRCEAICRCTMDGLRGTKLWAGVLMDRMSPDEEAAASVVARRCAASPPAPGKTPAP
jgi:uncharacterized membrane protein